VGFQYRKHRISQQNRWIWVYLGRGDSCLPGDLHSKALTPKTPHKGGGGYIPASLPYSLFTNHYSLPHTFGEKSVSFRNVTSCLATNAPSFSDSAFTLTHSGSAENIFQLACAASRLLCRIR